VHWYDAHIQLITVQTAEIHRSPNIQGGHKFGCKKIQGLFKDIQVRFQDLFQTMFYCDAGILKVIAWTLYLHRRWWDAFLLHGTLNSI